MIDQTAAPTSKRPARISRARSASLRMLPLANRWARPAQPSGASRKRYIPLRIPSSAPGGMAGIG